MLQRYVESPGLWGSAGHKYHFRVFAVVKVRTPAVGTRKALALGEADRPALLRSTRSCQRGQRRGFDNRAVC